MRRLLIIGSTFVLATLLTTSCSHQECCPIDLVDETYVHKYGVAVPSDFWTASGKDGSVISTMADGVIITRGYQGGLLDGETTYTFPYSSQIFKKEIYASGTLVKEIEFSFDGSPQSEVTYDSELGLKTISAWYLSGTPRSIEQYNGNQLLTGEYFTNSNQREAWVENYEGTRIVRDDHGLLLATDTIQNGQMTMRTTYHPNGSPKEMTPYQNGYVHGTRRTFLPAGEPEMVEQWSDGLQNGLAVTYNHGEKYSETPYVQGMKEGQERRFRNGEEVVQEISWSKDQLHGPSVIYVGDNAKKEWYHRGTYTTEADYNFMVNKPSAR